MIRRVVAALLCALCCGPALAGCATGKDAVVTGGRFEFVAPNGQQIIFYDPPEKRGALGAFGGPSLLHPGRQVGVQDYPGNVVVINIWGSWCGVCRPETKDLQHLADNVPGVSVLGVDIRDTDTAGRDFLNTGGITYDSIFDPPGRVLFQLNGYPRNVVPSTIVLDRRHRVAAVCLTRIRLADFTLILERLTKEPAAG